MKYKLVLGLVLFILMCEAVMGADCGGAITEDTVLDGDLLDCPSNGLIISASNIMLDCNGHTISGSGSTGVLVSNYNNVIIKDCNVDNFGIGIYLQYSSDCIVTNNNITESHSSFGMILDTVVNSSVYNNNFTDNTNGIYLVYDTRYNEVYQNYVKSTHAGITVYVDASNNVIHSNLVELNNYGMHVYSDGNLIYNNIFRNNNIHAEETLSGNSWSLSTVGNYWDDFVNNPGFPYYYNITGPGDGVDWHPVGGIPDADEDGVYDDTDNCLDNYNPGQENFDLDGYGAACDCNDFNALINPSRNEFCNNLVDENCDGRVNEGCAKRIPLDDRGLPGISK